MNTDDTDQIEQSRIPMSSISDPAYVSAQYRDASNLNARIHLHARYSTNAYGFACGRTHVPAFNWLDGRVDEVYVFNRILAAHEFRYLRDIGKANANP